MRIESPVTGATHLLESDICPTILLLTKKTKAIAQKQIVKKRISVSGQISLTMPAGVTRIIGVKPVVAKAKTHRSWEERVWHCSEKRGTMQAFFD